MRVALADERGRRRLKAATAQPLQFALYADKESAT
jgi:hypothetical protein